MWHLNPRRRRNAAFIITIGLLAVASGGGIAALTSGAGLGDGAGMPREPSAELAGDRTALAIRDESAVLPVRSGPPGLRKTAKLKARHPRARRRPVRRASRTPRSVTPVAAASVTPPPTPVPTVAPTPPPAAAPAARPVSSAPSTSQESPERFDDSG